jgi:arginase
VRLGLIGVPYTSSGQAGGEARAPQTLRAAGLVGALGSSGDVFDYGDVAVGAATPRRDPVTGIIAPDVLAGMVSAVRAMVRRSCDDGRLPLVVGGECPILLGCLAAARDVYERVGLLFCDGHEDAWPPHQSTTGEAADMELGFALGFTRPDGVAALDALLPLVQPNDAVLLGPRDRDELAEASQSSLASAVTLLNDATLRRQGPGKTTRDLAARLSAAAGRWWFHLDLDVLATEDLAAVRYPQPGGLSWDDLDAMTEAALATPGLVGWNVTIYNPDLDQEGSGSRRIVAFLGEHVRHLTQL